MGNGDGRLGNAVDFARLKAAALSVAGLVALVGLVVLVLARLIPEGSVRSVIEDVAALVFAIGLIQILFETYLHAHLAEEVTDRVDIAVREVGNELEPKFAALQSALQLDRALGPSGVTQLTRSTVNWTEILRGSSVIDLVPWALDTWLQQEWPAILEHARSRRIEVNLYLPNADGPCADALCLRFDRSEGQLKDTVGHAMREASEGWRSTARVQGSILRIQTYDQPPGIGLLLFDDGWALTVPPVHGPRPGKAPLVALASNGSDIGYREWLESQVGQLAAQPFDQVEIHD